MTLHTDSDHIHLVTDPTLFVIGPEGRPQGIVPYRLGVPPINMRRDAQGVMRPFQPGMQVLPPQMMALQSGNPLAVQQLKKMQPPTAAPQMRISSGGGMRPPSIPLSTMQQLHQQPAQPQTLHASQQPQGQTNTTPVQSQSPPHSAPIPVSHLSPPNTAARPGIAMPHIEVPKAEVPSPPLANGIPAGVPATHADAAGEGGTNGTPVRPKSQNFTPQQHLGLGANGYHLTPVTNMTALLSSGAYPLAQNGQHMGGLSQQQVQTLKTAFASLSASEVAALSNGRPLPGSYLMPNMNMQLAAGANLKIPAARQQWAAMNSQLQRPASIVNGIVDGQLNSGLPNGIVSVSPTMSQAVPVRSPSANGQRAVLRNHVNGQHSLSPHLQPSPSPLPNISQSQSPPRIPMMPNMGLPSPSLQQQPVGSNQNGY